MKKTLLILALALSLNLSYAQRDIDWSIEEILMPTELRTTGATANPQNNTAFNYTIVCKNNSDQDTILPTDTLGIRFFASQGNTIYFGFLDIRDTNQIFIRRINRRVNPGDTIHISGMHNFGIRPTLSFNLKINFFSILLNRDRNTGIPQEVAPNLANNFKSKVIVWYAPQGWGVSINDINKDILSVYPNPATSNLTINLDIVGNNNSFEIFDMSGKLVKADALNNFDGSQEINVSEFSKGIYILKANNGSQIYTTKFIVE